MNILNGNTTVEIEHGKWIHSVRPIGFVFKTWFFGFVEYHGRVFEQTNGAVHEHSGGAWECKECGCPNKPEWLECSACETPRPHERISPLILVLLEG